MSNFYLKGRMIFNINTLDYWNEHSTFIPANGELIFIKDTNTGIITEKLGDGITSILNLPDHSSGSGASVNSNIENGEGENSLQLSQEAEEFSYKGSLWQSPVFKTGATGKGSVLLSTLGRVQRNHFLDIGNLNIVEYGEKETPYEEQDDGGIIAGYKNYSNSRAASLFGAWNRAIDAKQSFISGYSNTTRHTASGNSMSLNIGTGNYLFGNTHSSALIGSYLLGNGQSNSQFHIGLYNKPDTGIQFSIGNGTRGLFYYNLADYKGKPGYTLEDAINHNKIEQYSPEREFCWYLGTEFGAPEGEYILITESTTQEEFDSKLMFERRFGGRSNSLQVTFDGRAQLIRKENHAALVDNDLLTKKEIEDKDSLILNSAKLYTDDRFNGANKAVSFEDYETMISALNGLENTKYNVGQDVLIVTLEVPDLWISDIAESNVTYTYTTDEDFVNVLKTNGSVQIGYFVLSALETQKVDLTDYVNKTTYPSDTQAGVVRADATGYSETGVSANQSTGLLYLSQVTDTQLKAQTNPNVAVSPAKLARAIKQGLINPDIGAFPANWTDDEKALARTTIGATKLYKHIISLSNEEGYKTQGHFYSLNNEPNDCLKYENGHLYLNAETIISMPYLIIGDGGFTDGVVINGQYGYMVENGEIRVALTLPNVNLTVTSTSEIVEEEA